MYSKLFRREYGNNPERAALTFMNVFFTSLQQETVDFLLRLLTRPSTIFEIKQVYYLEDISQHFAPMDTAFVWCPYFNASAEKRPIGKFPIRSHAVIPII